MPSGMADPVQQNQNTTVFESAPIQQLAAKSTVEISRKLSANRARWLSQQILLVVLATIIIVAGIIVYANASRGNLNGAVIVMFVGACIAWLATALYCRQLLTVSLEYNLSDAGTDASRCPTVIYPSSFTFASVPVSSSATAVACPERSVASVSATNRSFRMGILHRQLLFTAMVRDIG
jgi:uncharacterized membrane protein